MLQKPAAPKEGLPRKSIDDCLPNQRVRREWIGTCQQIKSKSINAIVCFVLRREEKCSGHRVTVGPLWTVPAEAHPKQKQRHLNRGRAPRTFCIQQHQHTPAQALLAHCQGQCLSGQLEQGNGARELPEVEG